MFKKLSKKLTILVSVAFAVLVSAVATFAANSGGDPQTIGAGIGSVIGGGALLGLIGFTYGGQAPAPPPSPPRQMLAFRENTRQKVNPVGTATYGLGSTVYLTVPKIGYLSKIYLRFNGVITSTSAGADTITYAKFAPFSVFRNIQLDLNSGKQILANLSGYELFLHNAISAKNGRGDQQTDSDFYTAPTTGSAQTFRVTLEIPVAISDGQNFGVGLINLQAPELQCNLTLSFLNALTDLGTNISTLTGTVDVAYEYYEVPDPSQVLQPPVVLHKIISQPQAVSSTGENTVELPRGGDLLRAIQILECNGAKSDAYDNLQVKLNKTQLLYKMDRWTAKWRNRRMYGYNLPTGVTVWDFQNAYAIPEESDLRDVIDTERATTTELVTTITSGTTLGSNNNFIYTVREFIQIPV